MAMSMESATNRGQETMPVAPDAHPACQPTRGSHRTAASVAVDREGVIIARLKLRLHLHVAGGCGPDERVSLGDARMGGELPRYIGLLARLLSPIHQRCFGTGEPAPSLGTR